MVSDTQRPRAGIYSETGERFVPHECGDVVKDDISVRVLVTFRGPWDAGINRAKTLDWQRTSSRHSTGADLGPLIGKRKTEIM